MHDNVAFGRRLRQRRNSLDLTQEELADRAGCTPETVRKLEAGSGRASKAQADGLADALHLVGAERAEFLRLARDHPGSVMAPAAGHRPSLAPGAYVQAKGEVPVENQEPAPLLATKLYVPRPRASLVPRPRLLARLEAGLQGLLTLIAAPAGSGKTTLLAEWLSQPASADRHIAWLALDAADSDPIQFLRYLIAALQTIAPTIGPTIASLLRSAQPPPLEALLPVLANDLVRAPEGSLLVLDDYHVVEAPAVHQALAFLLDHLPPQLQLVIASRADPPLPLSRLRARGQLAELRAHDLRFTTEEAAAFLQEVMELPLTAADVAAVEARTEGWIAGLQLAALSLQDRPTAHISSFIDAFTGSHRFVVDYLVDEVLARQPAHVQRFLLETSILERLSGPLCDSVVGAASPTSQALVEQLERANLFIVPLDEARRWYRYHHLFAQVLRERLASGATEDMIAALHRRASAWFEQQGLVVEAVQHAIAGHDWEQAGRLIEEHGPLLLARGQVHAVLGWLTDLPDALFHGRSPLYAIHGLALFFVNQLDAAELRLNQAEAQLPTVSLDDRSRAILGHITVIRASIARYRGDLSLCVSLARQALELVPETNLLLRASPLLDVAADYVITGDVTPDNEHRLIAAVEAARASGDLHTYRQGLVLLAGLRRRQGRLRKAAATYREATEVAAGPDSRGMLVNSAASYFRLGDVLREWNQLDAAAELLEQGRKLVLGMLVTQADIVTFGYISMARVQQARGDTSGARATLAQLHDLVQQRDFAPHLLARSAAARAHLALLQGDLETAVHWADMSGLDAGDDPSYLHEVEYLTLARVRIAQGHDEPASSALRDALRLLDRLGETAEAGSRMDTVIEVLVLRALALRARNERNGALDALEQALSLAASEGYVRVFVDEGIPMAALLQQGLDAPGWGTATGSEAGNLRLYARRLLDVAYAEGIDLSSAHPASVVQAPVSDDESLSPRELEVLQLLAAGRSNQAIAEELIVAVGTVKRHVSNIMSKLMVESRLEAVARARELGLV